MPEKMIDTLPHLENFFRQHQINISNVQADLECEEYFGYNFQLNKTNIKFRKAKITPKKIGQFVTLWRRNANGITEPFNFKDDFEFYIIYVERDEQKGFFFFSKQVLAEKQILINGTKDGKRGFRVYPSWDAPENKQAEKTQVWQSEFFINLGNEADVKKVNSFFI
mgnify:CR=1 FL=1